MILPKSSGSPGPGNLNADRLMKLAAVYEMFFWIGWHARGATDDADKLPKL